MEKIIEKVLYWINSKFNQDNMPELYIPYKYSNDCVVFFHGIGGIILYKDRFQTFSEDDGYFFLNKHTFGITSSSAWLKEWEKGFKTAKEYLEKNGIPYYYSGTDIICGYSLGERY